MPISHASRLRLLRCIAAIDWSHWKHFLFVTLTYPDSCFGRSLARQTQDRTLFLRKVEEHYCRCIACLWRKEWQPRKTGKHVGEIMPHWHLILFGVPWIDYRVVRAWWRAILDVKGPLATDVRSACEGEHAARYTAKYAGKYCSGSLDNPAYLDKQFGRPWGFTRANQIPWLPRIVVEELTDEEVAKLRSLGARMWPRLNPHGEQGWTVFHPQVGQLRDILGRGRVDENKRCR